MFFIKKLRKTIEDYGLIWDGYDNTVMYDKFSLQLGIEVERYCYQLTDKQMSLLIKEEIESITNLLYEKIFLMNPLFLKIDCLDTYCKKIGEARFLSQNPKPMIQEYEIQLTSLDEESCINVFYKGYIFNILENKETHLYKDLIQTFEKTKTEEDEIKSLFDVQHTENFLRKKIITFIDETIDEIKESSLGEKIKNEIKSVLSEQIILLIKCEQKNL